VLPTLGPERRATYSPFLPISPQTGVVLQVPILEWDVKRGTIVFEEDGKKEEVPVTGGRAKLQWKADWAMRWLALGVDYEMAGKDLISSVELSSKIVRAIGGCLRKASTTNSSSTTGARKSPSRKATACRWTNG